jgi:hypothetical protein
MVETLIVNPITFDGETAPHIWNLAEKDVQAVVFGWVLWDLDIDLLVDFL